MIESILIFAVAFAIGVCAVKLVVRYRRGERFPWQR